MERKTENQGKDLCKRDMESVGVKGGGCIGQGKVEERYS